QQAGAARGGPVAPHHRRRGREGRALPHRAAGSAPVHLQQPAADEELPDQDQPHQQPEDAGGGVDALPLHAPGGGGEGGGEEQERAAGTRDCREEAAGEEGRGEVVAAPRLRRGSSRPSPRLSYRRPRLPPGSPPEAAARSRAPSAPSPAASPRS